MSVTMTRRRIWTAELARAEVGTTRLAKAGAHYAAMATEAAEDRRRRDHYQAMADEARSQTR